MNDNLKESLARLNTFVKQITSATKDLSIKSNDLLTIIEAINKGIITTDQGINDAIVAIKNQKFNSKAGIESLAKTIGLAQKESDQLVDIWLRLSKLNDATLQNSLEYKNAIAQTNSALGDQGNLLLDILNSKKKIGKELKDFNDKTEDGVESIEEITDLTSDLIKKFDKLNNSININTKLFDFSNLDTSIDALQQIRNLTSSVELFDNTDLTKQINDSITSFRENMDLLKNPTNTEIKLSKDNIDNKQLEEQYPDLLKSIDSEFNHRKKKLLEYIKFAQANSLGLEYNDDSSKLKSKETGEDLNLEDFKIQNQLIQDNVKNISLLAEKLTDISSLSVEERKNLNDQLSVLSDIDKAILSQYKNTINNLSAQQAMVKIDQAKLNLLNAMPSRMEKLNNVFSGLATNIDSVVTIVPYSLQQMLGIFGLSGKVIAQLQQASDVYSATLADTQSSEAARSAFIKSFTGSLKSSFGTLGLITLAFAGIYSLVSLIENKVSELATTVGISRGQADKLNKSMYDVIESSTNRLLNEEQIINIQKDQIEKYGQLLDLTNEVNVNNIKFASDMEAAFGVASTDAYNLLSTFKNIGADNELAKQLVADVGYMSEMAGISPNIIAKDLLESGKELSLYFSGYPKEAAKAIIQIRRMGMSLKQASQIADKMMNIEGFMTDMAELSAMSGGSLNLSKAFDLRMSGDLTGMTEEVMNQIGSLEEFGSLNEFTQRKLSNTLGMEIDDLRKSLKLRSMQNSLSKDQLTVLQDNLSTIGDINNMSLESMKQKAEELNSTKKLGVAFDKIKATLMKALVPLAEAFSNVLDGLSGILDLVGLGFKAIGGIMRALTPLIKGFIMPFKLLGQVVGGLADILNGIFERFTTTSDEIEPVKASLFSVGDAFKYIAESVGVLLGARYMGKFLGLGKVIGPMFDKINPFKKIMETVQNINPFKKIMETIQGTNPLEKMQAKLTDKKGIFSKVFDKINPFKSTEIANTTTNTSTTNTIDSKTMDVNSKSLETEVNKTSKLSTLLSSAVDKIKAGFKLLGDFVVDISSTIKDVLTNVGQGIGNFIQSLLTGLGEGLSKFQPKALIGVVAIAGLAGSLWLIGKAMQEFNSIKWDSMAKAGIALVGFGAAMTVFSSFSGAIALGAGALALGSAALWAFSKALLAVSVGIESFGPTLSNLFTGLQNIDITKLLLLGPAIAGIAASLALLGAGSAISKISELFSGDPFAKLEKLAILTDPIERLSNALSVLVDNLTKLPTALNLIQPATIESSSKVFDNNSTIENITPTVASTYPITNTETVNNSKNTNTETNISSGTMNTAKLERKLDQLIEIFNYYSNRPSYAVIEEPTIKTINSKIKALNNK